MKEIQVPRKKVMHILMLILGPLAMLNIYFALKTTAGMNIVISIVIILFALFVTSVVMRSAKIVFSKEPGILINNDGVTDNVSLAKAGLIPWNEINKFEIHRTGNAPHLFIFVRNTSKYKEKHGSFKQRMLEQLEQDKGTPILLNLKLLKCEPDSLQNLLEEYLNNQ